MIKNILCEEEGGIQLPREVQVQRLHRAIREMLTPLQRETIIAYYYQDLSIPQIAAERGVHKSTVARTLHRAEQRLREHLRY